MRTKTKSARRKPRRSSAAQTPKAKAAKAQPSEPKPLCGAPLCGAPLKSRAGAFCGNAAVKGGRCRYHIVEGEVVDDLEKLRLLQEAAERHAFSADEAMKSGGNGNKDATFNRNARTAAALAKARFDLKQRAAKTKDGEVAPDANTNIQIIDNQRGDVPKADIEPASDGGDAENVVAQPDQPPDPNPTEPDAA